jgi:hypothetical protein
MDGEEGVNLSFVLSSCNLKGEGRFVMGYLNTLRGCGSVANLERIEKVYIGGLKTFLVPLEVLQS